MTKLGDFVGEYISTTPAAQDHFMAPGQRLSRECERDSAGADRSKFHAPLVSFEIIEFPGRSRRHEISRHPPLKGEKSSRLTCPVCRDGSPSRECATDASYR